MTGHDLDRQERRAALDAWFDRAHGGPSGGLAAYVQRIRCDHGVLISPDGTVQGCVCRDVMCSQHLLLAWCDELVASYEAKVQELAAETTRAATLEAREDVYRIEGRGLRSECDALIDEVESLRAKIAAVEQERDTAKVNAVAALRLLEADRDKLAAVREAVEPLSGFALDEFARSYARRDEDAAIVVQALYDLHQVLAAAEQDEPKRHCATLGHEDIPATITGTLWEGEDPDTGIRTAYCDECAQALADDAVFTPDEPKRCEHGSSPHCYPFCVSEPKREQS